MPEATIDRVWNVMLVGVGGQGPGQPHTLALPSRQPHGPGPHLRLITLRQGHDPIMQAHIARATAQLPRFIDGLQRAESAAYIKFPYVFDGEIDQGIRGTVANGGAQQRGVSEQFALGGKYRGFRCAEATQGFRFHGSEFAFHGVDGCFESGAVLNGGGRCVLNDQGVAFVSCDLADSQSWAGGNTLLYARRGRRFPDRRRLPRPWPSILWQAKDH